MFPLLSKSVVFGAAIEYSPPSNFFYPLSILYPKTADAVPLTLEMLEHKLVLFLAWIYGYY